MIAVGRRLKLTRAASQCQDSQSAFGNRLETLYRHHDILAYLADRGDILTPTTVR